MLGWVRPRGDEEGRVEWVTCVASTPLFPAWCLEAGQQSLDITTPLHSEGSASFPHCTHALLQSPTVVLMYRTPLPPLSLPRSALPPAKAAALDAASPTAAAAPAAAAASAAVSAAPAAAAVASPLSASQVASGRLWSAKVLLFSGMPEAALSAQDYKAFQVGRWGEGRRQGRIGLTARRRRSQPPITGPGVRRPQYSPIPSPFQMPANFQIGIPSCTISCTSCTACASL